VRHTSTLPSGSTGSTIIECPSSFVCPDACPRSSSNSAVTSSLQARRCFGFSGRFRASCPPFGQKAVMLPPFVKVTHVEVASALPFLVDFDEKRTDETMRRSLAGKDPDQTLPMPHPWIRCCCMLINFSHHRHFLDNAIPRHPSAIKQAFAECLPAQCSQFQRRLSICRKANVAHATPAIHTAGTLIACTPVPIPSPSPRMLMSRCIKPVLCLHIQTWPSTLFLLPLAIWNEEASFALFLIVFFFTRLMRAASILRKAATPANQVHDQGHHLLCRPTAIFAPLASHKRSFLQTTWFLFHPYQAKAREPQQSSNPFRASR